jgi:hypothetical protein
MESTASMFKLRSRGGSSGTNRRNSNAIRVPGIGIGTSSNFGIGRCSILRIGPAIPSTDTGNSRESRRRKRCNSPSGCVRRKLISRERGVIRTVDSRWGERKSLRSSGSDATSSATSRLPWLVVPIERRNCSAQLGASSRRRAGISWDPSPFEPELI